MIRVLVVDDSAIWRLLLTDLINDAPDLKVVGAAPDAQTAHELAKALNPDAMTLDIEMPVRASVEDLRRGAEEIRERIRAAAASRVGARKGVAPAAPDVAIPAGGLRPNPGRLVAIGASTGGTEAIKEVLTRFPAGMPGIVVVQHMPESFTASFARRLDGMCRVRVREAEHNERILPGTAYIAPGHSHLAVRRSGGHYVAELSRGEPVNRHRPSVDVLFHSVAEAAGANAVGVLLTGMGKDGAPGMLAMRRAGAWNIAQDQASCVVYGMPREAVALGAVNESLSLLQIPAAVVARLAAEQAAHSA